MALEMELAKNDTLLLKDGRSVRVLSVFAPSGRIIRADVVDDASPTPTREAVFEKDFARILKKAVRPEPTAPPLPPEQAVKKQDGLDPNIKADVESRERHTTTAAESRLAATKGKR